MTLLNWGFRGSRRTLRRCRGLRREWEVAVPELDASVFILPETKNGQERVVVLSRVARNVLDAVRGQHPKYVFSYKGGRVRKMNNSAWKKARRRAGLPVRVHDLRHTFGHRLRAAGVSFEDRQDLLGHKSDRMTTHYSAPELSRLTVAGESVCKPRPATVLRVVPNENVARVGQKKLGKKAVS